MTLIKLDCPECLLPDYECTCGVDEERDAIDIDSLRRRIGKGEIIETNED